MKDRVVEAFQSRFGSSPTTVVRSPGRVNLIGEHTDYNAGFVLPMAIDRAIWLALRPRDDECVRVDSLEQSDGCEYALGDLQNADPDRDGGWGAYLKGLTKMLLGEGMSLRGWEGVLTSDIPIGSGLSSSAALEMAVGYAFSVASGFPFEGMKMARLGQRAENEWVGANTGIMDQLISANGQAGSALLIDCRDLSLEPIPMPSSVSVVVMDTMTRHDHRSSGYNDRRASCEAAARAFDVSYLRELNEAEFETRMARSPAPLEAEDLSCAKHVVSENARVLAAAEAMKTSDVVALGELMDASHVSLRDDFRVSTEALDTMVRLARDQPGCYGARMTGGGFGGCAVALVDETRAEEIEARVARDYEAAMGKRPAIFSTRATNGTASV